MKLLALNRQWAVYSPDGEDSKPDNYGALNDLLSVSTYGKLIKFLETHAACRAFVSPRDDIFSDSFDMKRTWYGGACDIGLKGNLNKEIAKHVEIDLLDQLTIDDYKGMEFYKVDLTELMRFKELMVKFLTVAAVSLGADAPDGLFEEIPTEFVLDASWIQRNLHCKTDSVKTVCLPFEAVGLKYKGFFPEEAFVEAGIFSHLDKCSPYQLVIDDTKADSFVGYTDGYPLSVDCVIYGIDDLGESSDCYKDCLTVSFLEPITQRKAENLLAGRAIEAIMNEECVVSEQYDFCRPFAIDDFTPPYEFIPGKGFERTRQKEAQWWVENLYGEAIQLILDGKVSLCPVCGSPVLTKDYRGNKPKTYCSNSCKTEANKQRREKTLQMAAAGFPIEEAIEAIGDEYADSIKRWYSEAIKPGE